MALSAADLTRFRATVAPLLRDSCQVVRDAAGPDDVEDWQPHGSPIACELGPLSSGETDRLQNTRFDEAVPYKLVFLSGADLTSKDRVVVNGARTVEVRQMVSTGLNEVERTAYVVERLSG